jgi:hypothetical protein
MSSRDEELDALEAELKQASLSAPYIEKPDQLDIGDGTACWIDVNRMCNSTCRAWDYEVDPPQGPDVCRALRALTDIPEVLVRLVDVASVVKKKTQDNQRAAAATAPVPDPTGRNSR